MTTQEQQQHFEVFANRLRERMPSHLENLIEKMRDTMLKKGNDYAAGQDDRLINFKQPASVIGIHPAKLVMGIMEVKVSRISNLLDSKGKPNFESLDDNALDLAVYSVLNHAVLSDTELRVNEPKSY